MKSALHLIHDIISHDQRRSMIDHYNSTKGHTPELSQDGIASFVTETKLQWSHPAVIEISKYITTLYPDVQNGTRRINNKIHPESFILKYSQGSFMRPHKDNKAVALTCVTLIGETQDLYGGVPFFVDDEDQEKIFSAHLKPGQSLVYPQSIRHGVSLIERGTRLVHVCWFHAKGAPPATY